MDKIIERIDDFMSKKVIYQRNCFLQETLMRNPDEFRIPENDEFFIYVDDEWKITKNWADYLLDKFSSDWDRENLSYDQWYFEWYICALNDLNHFINTKINK